MPATDVITLRNGYEAFARRDIPAVLAAFSEDIDWHVPDSLPYGGDYHGHEGAVAFFSRLAEYWQEMAVEPEEFIDAGDTIVVRARFRGSGAERTVVSEELHLWRMRSGKAKSFTAYSDTARELEAIGRPMSEHPTAATRR